MISTLLTTQLILAASSVVRAAVFFDPTAVKHSCVADDGSTLTPGAPLHLPDVNTTAEEQTILLKPIRPTTPISGLAEGTSAMCVFHRWTLPLEDKDSKKGFYFPLGRSVPSVPAEVYGNITSGYGDWTRPPGKASRQLEYVCGEAGNAGENFEAGEYLCEVTLPTSSHQHPKNPVELVHNDLPYYLTYYQRSMTVRNELSRFLQTNTFGPTQTELNTLEATFVQLQNEGYTHAEAMSKLQRDWIQAQMDPSTFTTGEFSSLRKYWRRRLNPRKIETYRIGESGPHPCETNSRWRKFAFTNYDAQLSKGMRWGTQELGGSYQTAPGHKITVETVEYYGSADIDAGGTPAPITGSPTSSPVAIPSSTLGPTSLASTITTVPLPTGPNLLPFGDMEGTEAQLKNMWPSGCARSLVLKTDSPDLVAEGSSSLHVTGGTKCFLFRPIGLGCTNRRVAEPINAGDTIKISLKVRLDTAGQVFQMYTGHYHTDKLPRGWGLPEDDSYMISRTKIPNADEWTTINVIHKIGDDWKKGGMMLTPQGCNHYQLRFRVANSAASYYLDDVSVSKISPSSDTNSTDISVPKSGFFTNPGFEMDHQYWKTAATSGYITNDAQLKHNVMVMKRGQALRQNVMDNAVLGQQYQFGFNIKLANVDAIKMRIILRMKFTNNDLQNGPCPKHTCNFYKRPLVKSIRSSGGEWQHVVTEKFDMFDDFMDWSQYGTVDFVLFEMNTRDMDAGGEYRVADFAMMDEDYTTAPSLSLVPSSAPTNLIQTHIGYIVRYAGEIRTVVRHPFQVDATGEVLPMDGTDEYELCEVDEVEGRKAEFPNRMNFVVNGRCSSIRGGNPTIDLDPNFVNQTNVHVLDLSNQTVTPINAEQTYGGDLLLETGVQDEEVCAALPTPYDNDYRGGDPYNPDTLPSRFEPDKPVFAKLPGGTYALFDSRLLLHENTLENPLMDGGATSVLRSTIRAQNEGLKTKPYPWNDNEYFMINDQNIALCLNEQPNWLNHDSCVLSYEENVCVKEYVDTTRTLNDVQLVITFDDETLSNFHNATLASFAETGIDNSRYFYAVGNLRWDDSVVEGNITELPCTPLINPVSRWKPRSDLDASTCSNTIAAKSITVLKHALETSNDENPYLRDVYLWNGLEEDGCDEADYDAYGMLIMTNEGCWENVHPDHMSIYDFTGSEAEQNWATAGGILEFPDSLPVSQFEELKEEWGKIQAVDRYHYASSSRVNQGARYGDTIILDQFAEQMLLNNDPVILKSIADNFAVITLANKVATNRGGGTLVCGSPNEVAPDPTLDDYFDVIHRDLACIGCQESYGAYEKQKSTVWAMAVLEGEDQLCQRMAWSLYELLNVGTASNPDNTESNLFTYDIHLRHCFGNYFDVLKEMTFNSKMSEQFNFVDSTSTRITWETSGALVYPDENYGREVMQLFTIGLHELNPDGTETRDEHGRVIQTYTNFDILSNSRIMTGFTFTARRGNVEELFRSEKSRLDPLRIEVDKHDFFPKTSVDGNWIGDRYPLCVDLPEYHFLKIGAVYKFRGGSSLPMAHYNPPHWDSDESIKRFVLDPSSGLYQQLCNPGADGSCNFSQTVTLDSNLACYSKECRIDDLEVVQVAPGAFYEYIRQPCVNLSFYPTPKKVITGFSPWVRQVGRRHTHAMCADPRTAVAARSCCGASEPNKAVYNYDLEYHGERVEFSTSLNQCTADSGTLCDPSSMIADNPLVEIRPVYNYPYPSHNTFFWTAADCALSVKVRDDGMIAIIHDPASNPWFSDETVPYVDLVNTRNYISVTWEKDPMTFIDMYPSLSNTCGSGACSITSDDACLCPVTLNEVPVYNSLPSRKEVLSLKIGAIDPDTFSDATVTYSLLESSDDVEAHVSSDSGAIGSTSTIFKVTDEYGEIIFLKNMISTITLGNYEIRNPPSFMNLVKVELRDAEYEVDAFLMHLIRYPSAAPFICKKLVQYHGISNPSPGFVQRVTQAFISGSFTSGGVTFGTDGKYGDLKAVAAAIALDPESLSAVIDEDPVSGNIREPLLKVMQFMRSLSFKRRPHVKFRHGLFDEIHYKIGQMVFDPPDQFSFFSSDYSPPGAFAEAELFSPESELLSMSAVVGMVNGLFSFVNYGLTHIDGGFGPSLRSLAPVGDYSTSVGHLTFPFQTNNGAPVTSTIDELSTMLTAGRLSSANKQVLVNAHAYFNENYGIDFADRVVLKLMATTSEFHTSNTLRKNGSFSRSTTPPSAKSSSPYKAIVYINLAGGADSFNILTPGSTDCTSLYDEYWEARGRGGGIGLKSDQIFDIDGSSAEISGCSNLGVTTLLPAYKDIFNEGKGVFFANMGHLHKHVTRENWLSETHTDLFSHHTMRLESHVVDAFREGEGPGVLGRMLDILETHGHAVGATSTNSRATIIDGSPTTGRLADIMPKEGMTRVHDRNFLKGEDQQLRAFLEEIHAETDDNSGIFGNAWSQSFVDLWNKTDSLVTTVRSTVLATSFPTPQRLDVGGISTQLQLIAQLINARNERGNGINRDVFYCEMGGYDAHFKVNTVMENKLPSLNHAVATFWAEIKAQGLADNVVVVQGSEFGRTITPNSNTGSDHAWGGNYFMFGGDVKGGKIKGEYPKSFSASDSTNIGRGRLLPTTSWDALFYALTQWMGITDQDEIDYVLPNNQNFGCNLFTDYDLFNTGQQVLNGCGGATLTTPITFQVPDIRMLTGEEQKGVCQLAVRSLSNQLGFIRSKARCYVSDMTIVMSETSPGNYDVNGNAVLNFDGAVISSTVTQDKVEWVSKAAAATASDFVVLRAIPQSESPSQMPSMQPSTSLKPSISPSMSSGPSKQIKPSASPSFPPSVALTSEPTDDPTFAPTLSIEPTNSHVPTPGLTTVRHVFDEDFTSMDIGDLGVTGESEETSPGLYTALGSGADIWGTSNSFHYMHLETSGDVTLTVLVEGFEAVHEWAKGGVSGRTRRRRRQWQ